jgi:hypothetical protein
MVTDVDTWGYFFEAIHVKIVECEVVVVFYCRHNGFMTVNVAAIYCVSYGVNTSNIYSGKSF